MGINIYVGNLSFDTTEDQLRQMFEAYGAVSSAKVITDQFTGRSKGFAFIEMGDREEGMKAIKELDTTELGGRNLKVNEAKPKRDSRDSRGGGGGGGRSRW